MINSENVLEVIVLKILSDHHRDIVCMSCLRPVTAYLLTYADGYISTCPICKKLAHLGK